VLNAAATSQSSLSSLPGRAGAGASASARAGAGAGAGGGGGRYPGCRGWADCSAAPQPPHWWARYGSPAVTSNATRAAEVVRTARTPAHPTSSARDRGHIVLVSSWPRRATATASLGMFVCQPRAGGGRVKVLTRGGSSWEDVATQVQARTLDAGRLRLFLRQCVHARGAALSRCSHTTRHRVGRPSPYQTRCVAMCGWYGGPGQLWLAWVDAEDGERAVGVAGGGRRRRPGHARARGRGREL
jgi:hypothetical protein